MIKWMGLALACLALTLGFLFLKPDLRGWTPANPEDSRAIVAAIGGNSRSFAIAECLPGSVIRYGLPDGTDGAGTASLTIFSCRSKSSAIRILLLWLVASLTYPLFFAWSRRRPRA